MGRLLLVRHGEPDWATMDERGLQGGVRDLVPLTTLGVRQATEVAKELAPLHAKRVLSSPATRALQTAAVVAQQLQLPLEVRFDLREWVPDSSYQWTPDVLERATSEYRTHHGQWPSDGPRPWERISELRDRAHRALRSDIDETGPTIVVAHEVLICALTGRRRVGLCEIVEVETENLLAP